MNIRSPDEWADAQAAHWQSLSRWTQRIIIFCCAEVTALALLVAVSHAACVTGVGGDVDQASRDCAREQPRCWQGGVSADILALCAPGARVSVHSSWGFHTSMLYDPNRNVLMGRSAHGNALMKGCVAHYPALYARLSRLGAFNTQRVTWLSGAELGRLGVPTCGR